MRSLSRHQAKAHPSGSLTGKNAMPPPSIRFGADDGGAAPCSCSVGVPGDNWSASRHNRSETTDIPGPAAETGKQIAFREVLSFSHGGFAEKWQGPLVADDHTSPARRYQTTSAPIESMTQSSLKSHCCAPPDTLRASITPWPVVLARHQFARRISSVANFRVKYRAMDGATRLTKWSQNGLD